MKAILSVLVSLAWSLECTARADTLFFFTSSPTSWVGQGQTMTMSETNGYTVTVNLYGNALEAQIHTASWSDWWWVDFQPADGAPFQTGLYLNAQRTPGQAAGHPGLTFVGEARGDDSVSGFFNVLEFSETNGVVTSAAINFTQYDETNPSWWNIGSLRYNSIVPVPEPSDVALTLLGSGLVIYGSKRRFAWK
jgi:hypothetical protein